MNEIEVRGYIKKADFYIRLEDFKSKFGDPLIKKRLALTLGAYDAFDLETKIRITNGIISITQKYGDQNDISRKEHEMNRVNLTAEQVIGLYRIFEAYQLRMSKDIYAVAIQHENYLFYPEDNAFEIKLFRQFRSERDEFFGFEIEQMQESNKTLDDMIKELNLKIANNYNSPEVVVERNAKYNLLIDTLSDSELVALIQRYLQLIS